MNFAIALIDNQVTQTHPQLIELWLHGRSPHTERDYRVGVTRFLADIAKSVLSFNHRLGLLPVTAVAALKDPSVKNTLAASTWGNARPNSGRWVQTADLSDPRGPPTRPWD
jgi:hypothetical protein